MIIRLLLFLAISFFPVGHGVAQSISTAMVSVSYKGKDYIGQPLAWDGKEVVLLRRDGRITRLPVTDLKASDVVKDHYEPYGNQEIARELRAEFGSKYQVSSTKNFVVVHPPGSSKKWARPFQDLYYRFGVYFRSRGIELDEPKSPLVAIVLRTRKEYDRFIKHYQPGMEFSAGYYSARSNRIITYDHSDQGDWLDSNATIVHEAAHQTAYNTGIHRRFASSPRWVTEGLAQLFEAKGVNSSRYGQRLQRINKQAMQQLLRLYQKQEVAGALEQLVLGDNMFRTDLGKAYAISWGITLFLSEKYPKKYVAYLTRDGDREPFRGYSRTQRADDFARFFGANFVEIEDQMRAFFDDLSEQ